MKTTNLLLFAILIMLFLSSCAPHHHSVSECIETESEWGFFGGLWHGFISPITFMISLFNNNVEVWAVNNNGGWYTFGFLCGAGVLFGGSTSASKK